MKRGYYRILYIGSLDNEPLSSAHKTMLGHDGEVFVFSIKKEHPMWLCLLRSKNPDHVTETATTTPVASVEEKEENIFNVKTMKTEYILKRVVADEENCESDSASIPVP